MERARADIPAEGEVENTAGLIHYWTWYSISTHKLLNFLSRNLCSFIQFLSNLRFLSLQRG